MTRRVLMMVLKAGVTVAFIVWLAHKVDVAELSAVLAEVDWSLVLLATLLVTLSQVVCAWRWLLLARGMGIVMSPPLALRTYYIGMFFSLFLPGLIGGDVVRGWLINRRMGGGRLLRIGWSILMERVNGVFALVTLAVPAGWYHAQAVPPFWLWAMSGLAALLYGGWPLASPILRSLRRLGWGIGRAFPEELLALWQPGGRWWSALLLSLSYQIVIACAGLMLDRAVGLGLPLDYYFFAFGSMALISSLPISISGHGVREGVLVVVLGWMGAPAAVATIMGILFFMTHLGGAVAGGVIWLLSSHPPMHPQELEAMRDDDPDLVPEQEKALVESAGVMPK